MWEVRYSGSEYLYGKKPNDFLQDPVPICNSAEDAEVFAMFQPSPWLYVPNQPLPVPRWWELDERTYGWKRPDLPWMSKVGMFVDFDRLA